MIVDIEISDFLVNKLFNFIVSINKELVFLNVEFVVIVILIDYDLDINYFNICFVELVISDVLVINLIVIMVIKLIVFVGYIKLVKE